MEILTWVFWGGLALLGSIALNMLASEAYDWCERWAVLLIRFAVRRLPAAKRERYEEEWLAHLQETPGKISKLAHAFGTVSFAMDSKPVSTRSLFVSGYLGCLGGAAISYVQFGVDRSPSLLGLEKWIVFTAFVALVMSPLVALTGALAMQRFQRFWRGA